MKTINRHIFLYLLLCGIILGSCCTASAAISEDKSESTAGKQAGIAPRLNKTSVTLEMGPKPATVRLKVLNSFGREIEWNSEADKIAFVGRKGLVTAVRAGTTTITAKVGKRTLRCQVTVKAAVRLNRPFIIQRSASMRPVKLEATVYGSNSAVQWSSSDSSVAAVSANGTVMPKNSGKAIITAKVKGVSAECAVTIIPPASIALDRTEEELLAGKSFTLKATITPEVEKDLKVEWSSSNENVAVVSQTGVVELVGVGSANITAKLPNGAEAVCKVTGIQYIKGSDYVEIFTPEGIKKYHTYKQVGTGGYIGSIGCVQTAVAIIASAYGKSYSPYAIHAASSSQSYSERYALRKMNASASLYGRAAISVSTASQILTDMGIKNKMVYRWSSTSAAIKQITEHVKQGKPALLKANNRNVGGIRVANGHHSMVLIGFDENGYGIFIDPWRGRINYAHGSGRYFKMSLTRFMTYHMTRPSSSRPGAFVTSLSSGGGYILVG